MCSKDDRVILHGRVKHSEVLNFIGYCHIFAYPSTWRETSCLSLIEAMSAGCYCITNDLTVLPETGMGFVDMYEFTFDEKLHVKRLQKKIEDAIENLYKFDPTYQITLTNKKHSWENISNKWIKFGQELLDGGNITK
jgi:glycosyltransferase involved in cell wall biosynthesis